MPTLTSVTNHFITGKEGFTTTTSGSVASGATTVGLNSVSGYTNGDTIAFVIDPTDANKKQVFTGTIDTSGVQVTDVVWTEGTNQTHAAGATVVDYTTATHQAALIKGLLVSHNQDGTIIPEKVGGAWQSYTPTLINLSGGTINEAKYARIGKTVHVKFKYTLGGAGVSGVIEVGLPVVAASVSQNQTIGTAMLRDATGSYHYGFVLANSTTGARIYAIDAAASYARTATTSATVPFTWASGDEVMCTFTYEAA